MGSRMKICRSSHPQMSDKGTVFTSRNFALWRSIIFETS